ncbi:MAG: ABC transporter ATP-binding protein [Acidobacteriota bacterium]
METKTLGAGSSASPLRRLWQYAVGHRRKVMVASACSVLNKFFDLAPPVLIGAAVDIVVRREASWLSHLGVADVREQVILLAVLTFIIWALESLLEYFHELLWRELAQEVQHELRLDAYAHIQTLELAYFEDASTGGLLSVLNDDVNQLERFLDNGANDLLQVATTVILVGAAFFALAPSVAWMSFLPIPVILWGSMRFQRLMTERYSAVRERVGWLNSQLANNLGGIATIKSFAAEGREVERIRRESDAYRHSNQRAIRLSSAFSPLIRIVVLVGFTATLIFGGFLALDGKLEVGAYSVMVFLTQRLLWPLTRLGQTFDLYQRAMASTRRILDLLSQAPRLVDGPRELLEGPRELTLDEVTFAYRDRESSLGSDGSLGADDIVVLHDLSLQFAAGRTTAIVGATGSGKSTVIKLLLRFYDPQRGSVRLDGVDLRELGMGDLRHEVGLVSQDVFLFHGTVRENVAYGRPDASLDELRAAAAAAEALEFIEELPQGWDTVVGERGQKLSGGQRQRLSIARAVLKDPPVLILDEATSAVDNETEAAIQRSMAVIAQDRTTIVIAHRLSTIRHADHIYVLHRGRVAEEGTHEALLEKSGLYSALWNVQTGEGGVDA